jgi:Fe-S-cluster-containing hydrogenase component 2
VHGAASRDDGHGAQRLTLGGYELGLLDFVYTCRTCSDARCLSPCEHDAIWKRVHVPFSIVLLVTMLAHIAIALHLM